MGSGRVRLEDAVARTRKPRRMWLLGLVGLAAVAITAAIVGLGPRSSPAGCFVRAAALMGYIALSLSAVSAAAPRELVRFFGQRFVRVHHALSITGLVMIVLHPVAYAVQTGSAAVFVPVFSSLAGFLRWGGRLSLYLFVVAATAAAVRRALGGSWRWVHLLVYAAFLLATVHAVLIGTDFQGAGARAAAVTMAVVVTGVLVLRRLGRRTR